MGPAFPKYIKEGPILPWFQHWLGQFDLSVLQKKGNDIRQMIKTEKVAGDTAVTRSKTGVLEDLFLNNNNN